MQKIEFCEKNNICSSIRTLSNNFPENKALIYPEYGDDGVISYARLAQLIESAAGHLRDRGICSGERVVLCLDNQPELILFAFACAWLGATAILANNKLGTSELDYLIEDSQAACIVTSSSYVDVFCPIAPKVRRLLIVFRGARPAIGNLADACVDFADVFVEQRVVGEPVPVKQIDAALIFYTSGTTSKPKGVVITHAHVRWAAEQNIANLSVTQNDITLLLVPLYHTLGFSYQMLTSLFSGGTVVLRRMFNPLLFWQDALDYRCTWTAMLPYTCHFIWDKVPDEHYFRFWGFPCRVLEIESRFRLRTVGWWGMTELFAIGCLTGQAISDAPNFSFGRPIPEYRHRLVNTRIAAEPFDTEISGDFEIKGEPGKTLFAGYLNKPEETGPSFTEDGWFKTGDRFFCNKDGLYFFEVRVKDIIRVCGENVSAAEIEFAVFRSGVVKEAAAVSHIDELQGEVPVVFATLLDEKSNEEEARRKIMDACEIFLAEFKQPKEVIFLSDFPRAEIGKIAKNKLRELINKET